MFCLRAQGLFGWRTDIRYIWDRYIRDPLSVIGKNVVVRQSLFFMSKDAPTKVSFVLILKAVGVR